MASIASELVSLFLFLIILRCLMWIVWSSSLVSQSLTFCCCYGIRRGLGSPIHSSSIWTDVWSSGSFRSTVVFFSFSLILCVSSGDGVAVLFLYMFVLFDGSSCWLLQRFFSVCSLVRRISCWVWRWWSFFTRVSCLSSVQYASQVGVLE